MGQGEALSRRTFGLALVQGGYLSAVDAWPFWLIWHPAAAAFALAPVLQMETMHDALRGR